MTTIGNTLLVGTKKFQISTAAVAIAAAAAITPVVAPVVSHAAPLLTAAPVLTWGFDEVDAALIFGDNDGGQNAAASAVPGADVASPAPSPAQLLQYLVQGIADGIAGIVRGAVVIGGTITYVAIAFTGGLITTVGNFLPGPVGDFFVGVGDSVNNVANAVAEALRVGPYATSTA